MGHTFYRRKLKKDLDISSRKTRGRSLFKDENMPDHLRTKRWKLKREAEKFFKSGDLGRAEKKLLKMLKMHSNDHYALSKLIVMYAEQGRFDEGRKIYETAEERGADGSAVYTAGMVLYHLAGEPEKSRKTFETAVRLGAADYATYSAMLSVYIDLEQAGGVRNIVGLASENNALTPLLLAEAFSFYFEKGMYDEAVDVIESAPKAIREIPRLRLAVMEVYRKRRDYSTAIEAADELIEGLPGENFDDDNYVHARTIRAYCMMHSGREPEAVEEFSELKEKVRNTNVHYPRILCGFIFCKPSLTEGEREHLLADLDFFGVATGRSMQDKIDHAIRIIAKDDKTKA